MQHHPRTRAPASFGIVVAALLFLSACGDDSEAPSADETSEDSGEDTPDTPEDPSAERPATDKPANGDDLGADSDADRSAELTGRWEIVNYTLTAGGGLTTIVGDVTPYLEFSADSSLTFQTGCNGGSATWETSGGYYEPSSGLDDTSEGQIIQIGDREKEQQLCDGFLGEQDADISANLERASRFVLNDDGGLLLLDEFVLVISEPAA